MPFYAARARGSGSGGVGAGGMIGTITADGRGAFDAALKAAVITHAR